MKTCSYCKQPKPLTDFYPDRRRGRLMSICNRMIGHAGDDAERLRAAAAYLDVMG